MASSSVNPGNVGDSLSFHHVHFYVDKLQSIEQYKKMEATMNRFLDNLNMPLNVAAGKAAYEKLTGDKVDPSKYVSCGQDVVEQLITGVGWRIIASGKAHGTSSLALRSCNKTSVMFIITTRDANSPKQPAHSGPVLDHFRAAKISEFYAANKQRAGAAVLSYEVKGAALPLIVANYNAKHPELVLSKAPHSYRVKEGTVQVFEVFAYHCPEQPDKADRGTIIRFVASDFESDQSFLLPGLRSVDAVYPTSAMAVFADHWVSNVVNRKQVLDTLSDTLGFTSKVNFNAGVVAAGEAIIESTVTGNNPTTKLDDKAMAFVNQQQVYMPINNALSPVGHVHTYLEEIGQGIQHLASRTDDLVALIQRANDIRRMTGKGFTFLSIPRSYYGRLDAEYLQKNAGIAADLSTKVVKGLEAAGLCDAAGVVLLDITEAQLEPVLTACGLCKGEKATQAVQLYVMRARYRNLYMLLRDRLSVQSYLQIVNNQILVDIQGNDILYQIFTSCVLQREPSHEAPFLEFIQRVCSEELGPDGKPKPLAPGCGGFGIRNFLTLFLSIEISKALRSYKSGLRDGDKDLAHHADRMVRALTAQLNKSNPILTSISDAMTAEADALLAAEQAKDEASRQKALKEAEAHKNTKVSSNKLLKALSERYKQLTRQIREERQKYLDDGPAKRRRAETTGTTENPAKKSAP